jgi:hypothetical protein
VRGAADRGVVAPALGVVLAFDHVHGEGAFVPGDAVGAVEVKRDGRDEKHKRGGFIEE